MIETGIVASLIFVVPFHVRWEYRRLVEAVPVDARARTRFYRRILVLEWGLVGLAALALWLSGRPMAARGFPVPTIGPFMLGVLIGALVGLALSVGLAAVTPRLREGLQRQMEPVRALLPNTPAERCWFAAVAITAGICEEVLFRGLLIPYLSLLMPVLIHALLDLRILVLPLPAAVFRNLDNEVRLTNSAMKPIVRTVCLPWRRTLRCWE